MTTVYVGVVTVQTMTHNAVIVERAAIERLTPREAVQDAWAIIKSDAEIDLPDDRLSDLHVGFVTVQS